MTELIAPTTRLHAAWLAARDDWGRGAAQPGSGLGEDDDVDSAAGFAAWVAGLHAQRDESRPPPQGRVPATYWWIAEDDTILGAITLRHRLNPKLLEAGGHIGYGVRPAARGRGLATWALREVLRAAADLGLDRVMLSCDERNPASARVIERCGGVLEDVRDTWLGHCRRYWIDLP
ncbi:GNAT family N-acetyltransferase [Dactylosporangium sp. NPDC051484]|uniref:GNAT family N-acetyltransferase n=1 Tax=Dactylosporangium sp. NPDC051484 TaxID=3154942 RepID=UPI00344CB241